MKYSYTPVSQTSAIIELIPETEQDTTLLKTLDASNREHDMTFHYHFEKGLRTRNASAVILEVQMIEPPKKALVSFEVVIGLG